jgi:hypothetical protein
MDQLQAYKESRRDAAIGQQTQLRADQAAQAQASA